MDGVLLETRGEGAVVYVGVEVDGQTDDLAAAHRLQAAWLAALPPHRDVTLEARLLVNPAAPSRLVLLARVWGENEQDAARAGAAAAGELATVPGVSTHRITDGADLSALLRPFGPHPGGMVEVRRPVAVARPSRPDAGVRYYATVAPSSSAPSGRALLHATLAKTDTPLVLGVSLRPVPPPPWLGAFVAENAAAYARLAQPAMWRPAGSLHQPLQHLAPDPFAVVAEAHYRHAHARYRGWLARLRIHLASPGPVPESLAKCVAETFGETVVARPPTPEAAAAFRRAFEALEQQSWPGEADALGEPLRVLSLAADPAEAAATLGLASWDLCRAERGDRERVLDVVVAVGSAMERAAPTYAGWGEEALRDHVATALNGAFAGSVYAEARNGQGRTDILVRVEDRTVLVVECKIWDGPKKLSAAVTQLLGYLTRRDSAAALLVFLRGRGPATIAGAEAAICAHDAFIRRGNSGEARSDFVLRRNDGGETAVTLVAIG